MSSGCSECNKAKIFCKGMCHACYSKMKRNTEEGKERMRLYNASAAAKEAQKRFWKKKRGDKPPRLPKENCKCGKPSKAKGYCNACYQRYYWFKIKDGVYPKRNKKFDSVESFKKIIEEVKRGITIRRACDIHNIDSSYFYKSITPLQKAELKVCKLIGAVNDLDEF